MVCELLLRGLRPRGRESSPAGAAFRRLGREDSSTFNEINRVLKNVWNLTLLVDRFQLFRPPCGSSTNTTGVPFLIFLPNKLASQFVSRTQPWDSALLTFEGLGVPWMPYPSADSPIQ